MKVISVVDSIHFWIAYHSFHRTAFGRNALQFHSHFYKMVDHQRNNFGFKMAKELTIWGPSKHENLIDGQLLYDDSQPSTPDGCWGITRPKSKERYPQQ